MRNIIFTLSAFVTAALMSSSVFAQIPRGDWKAARCAVYVVDRLEINPTQPTWWASNVRPLPRPMSERQLPAKIKDSTPIPGSSLSAKVELLEPSSGRLPRMSVSFFESGALSFGTMSSLQGTCTDYHGEEFFYLSGHHREVGGYTVNCRCY